MDLSELANAAMRPVRARSADVAAVRLRDLTAADVAMSAAHEGSPVEPSHRPIQRIRDTHHLAAQLLVQGAETPAIARRTGYAPSYIGVLRRDPAFCELIEYYRGQREEIFTNLNERLAAISMVAAEELLERITETPEALSNRELMEALSMTADRTGHGPQTKNTNVNVNVDLAGRLENARQRAFAPETLNLAASPTLALPAAGEAAPRPPKGED